MTPADWPQVARIYREGMETGNATFETEVPAWEAWDASHLLEHRIVAVEDDEVLGWAALSPVSRRECYRGVAEVSVYVAAAVRGRGIGRALLAALVESSERGGIWTLQATVFDGNAASLALHRGAGFREVGRRERIARLHGEWRDTILLERRSPTIV
jgi:phosphinothricin acetyltransferase